MLRERIVDILRHGHSPMVKYTLHRAYAKALEIVHPLLPADARHKYPCYATRRKKKTRYAERIDRIFQFQRNIDFIPRERARYILINKLSAMKFFGILTQNGGHFLRYDNSTHSSLFWLQNIPVQNYICSVDRIYSFGYINKSFFIASSMLLKILYYFLSFLYMEQLHNTEKVCLLHNLSCG